MANKRITTPAAVAPRDNHIPTLDELKVRFPHPPFEPLRPDDVPAPFTAETARASIESTAGLVLRMPGAYSQAVELTQCIRDRLAIKCAYPWHDPDEDPTQVGWIHNSREMLRQLADMLCGADVIALTELARAMLITPPDDDDFDHAKMHHDIHLEVAEEMAKRALKRGRSVQHG